MGRVVKTQTLTATTGGSKNFSVDLSSEKMGVYPLHFRAAAGIATQKLIINERYPLTGLLGGVLAALFWTE